MLRRSQERPNDSNQRANQNTVTPYVLIDSFLPKQYCCKKVYIEGQLGYIQEMPCQRLALKAFLKSENYYYMMIQ